jgi:Xaa-Pro aminopeptidase
MTTSKPEHTLDREGTRRIARLQDDLKRRGLDAMLVYDRHNTFYLTGFHCSLSYLFVGARGAVFYVDGRYIEAAQAAVTHCEVRLFKDWRESFAQWQGEARPGRIGFEGTTPWRDVRDWQDALPDTEWEECIELIWRRRLIKSPAEVRWIEQSAKLNDAVFAKAIESLRPGMTEIDVRNIIKAEADRLGADGLSFESIIGCGEMSSRPHYRPADRPLEAGKVLLIDMGMIAGGYCSDMTRVVALGKKPAARLVSAYAALLEAQVAAVEAVAPGVPCAEVDRVAREKLKEARLAKYFTHGLGHGVGLEIHEDPRLSTKSTEVLKPGMVITIEPGVYLPGLGGLRIEDLVLVTKTGHRVLSKSPKELRVVGF